MSEKEDVEVTIEEALKMEININQALVDLLIEKGIITEDELLEKVRLIRDEMN